MNAAAEQLLSRDKSAVRPFRVEVPDAELTDLRPRIKATLACTAEHVAHVSLTRGSCFTLIPDIGSSMRYYT
jgi:hypothetical protein